ncbi:MAG: DUF2330 domain-containing protein [Planctomycetales bacterium]|nr:DUF2330 domain-containing protein [Planctomycetales bacterium]
MTLTRSWTVAVGSVLLLGTASTLFGDMGSIPFKPWVSVYEPNQRAIIAFNGHEQILILSTDLRASEPTKVLEILPLPSEPQIKEGDIDVFRSATELINRKLFPNRNRGVGGAVGGPGGGGEPLPPAGEVTETKRIGAHDISVTHVLDSERFVEWAERFLEENNADEVHIPEALKEVVEEYLDDGFEWFAFDVVDLGTETVTKDAILYRFESRRLYYPLRITRAETGETKVRLLVLTPDLVELPRGPELSVRLVERPVDVTRRELEQLDPDLFDLLRTRTRTKLRIWETEGELSSFQQDIWTR